MQLLQNGLAQFIDSSGAPLASGTVGFYAPGTLNPLTTYQDQAGTIPNTNPIALNSRGQALIWGSGIFRQILKDASGVTIWDAIVTSTDAALSGSTGASLIGFDGTNLANQLTTRVNRVVDSILALRAISKATYTRVWVTGYYLPHDGGGGAYQYDSADTTTADNNGTVIVASDGGRWKLQIVSRVSILQFGAKGDDTTDDTLAVKAGVAWATATGQNLFIPATVAAYRLTSPIPITGNLKLVGESCFPTTNTGAAVSVRNQGSWFHIDHTGQGFNATAAGVSTQFLVSFTGIGTVRNQPTPSSTFSPTANDWDFYCSGVELYMDDVFCLNPTKFSFTTGGPASHYRRIRGQPLSFGVHTDFSADCCNYDDFHFWPFWSQQASVYTWTQANLRTLHFGRADTPYLSNIFSFNAFAGISFSTSTFAGHTSDVTSGLKGNNFDLDGCKNGLLIEGTAHGVDAMFTNFRHQGPGGATDSRGVFTLSTTSNSVLRFENFRSGVLGAEGIRVDGINNFVYLGSNTGIDQWNQLNAGWNAIDCIGPGTGNRVILGAPITTTTPTGTVTPYGGGGTFMGLLGSGTVSSTTNASGLVTVTHNLGATPTGILLTMQLSGAALTIQLLAGSSNANSFSAQIFTSSTGIGLNAGAVTFTWLAVF